MDNKRILANVWLDKIEIKSVTPLYEEHRVLPKSYKWPVYPWIEKVEGYDIMRVIIGMDIEIDLIEKNEIEESWEIPMKDITIMWIKKIYKWFINWDKLEIRFETKNEMVELINFIKK